MEVKKVTLGLGDVLICQVPVAHLPKTVADKYMKEVETELEEVFPGVRKLITDKNVEFTVMSVN